MTGYESGAVVVKCSYPKLYGSHQKYLCNTEVEKSKCVSVTDERFSLYDSPSEGYFMVLITQLTFEDSGIYQCLVDNAPRLVSTDIQLKVKTG